MSFSYLSMRIHNNLYSYALTHTSEQKYIISLKTRTTLKSLTLLPTKYKKIAVDICFFIILFLWLNEFSPNYYFFLYFIFFLFAIIFKCLNVVPLLGYFPLPPRYFLFYFFLYTHLRIYNEILQKRLLTTGKEIKR